MDRDKEWYLNQGICAEISIQPDGKYLLTDNYGGFMAVFDTLEDAKAGVPDDLTLDPEIKDYRVAEVEDCPNCPNQGWYGQLICSSNPWEAEQVQCEWCYENPKSRFNYQRRMEAQEAAV